jgi:hypothetical protein
LQWIGFIRGHQVDDLPDTAVDQVANFPRCFTLIFLAGKFPGQKLVGDDPISAWKGCGMIIDFFIAHYISLKNVTPQTIQGYSGHPQRSLDENVGGKQRPAVLQIDFDPYYP